MSEKVTINLNGEFGASDLDDIIRTLAERRAAMNPPVPATPEEAEAFLVEDNTSVKVRTLVDGGARIWLRSNGLGWCGFTVSATHRKGLARFLIDEIGDATYTLH